MKNKYPKIIRNVCIFNKIHKVLIFENTLQNTVELTGRIELGGRMQPVGKKRFLILKSSAGIMERTNGKMRVPCL